MVEDKDQFAPCLHLSGIAAPVQILEMSVIILNKSNTFLSNLSISNTRIGFSYVLYTDTMFIFCISLPVTELMDLIYSQEVENLATKSFPVLIGRLVLKYNQYLTAFLFAWVTEPWIHVDTL